MIGKMCLAGRSLEPMKFGRNRDLLSDHPRHNIGFVPGIGQKDICPASAIRSDATFLEASIRRESHIGLPFERRAGMVAGLRQADICEET